MPEPQSHEEAIRKLVAANISALKARKTRSTLTEQSAIDFKPYFDMAIEKGEDICVKFITFYTYTPLTLRRKVNDAMRYYCTNELLSNDERIKYMNLRRQVAITMDDDVDGGVWIRFKQAFQKHQHLRVGENTNFGDAVVWKEALMNYISEGCKGNFNLTGLTLTAEEIKSANNLLEQANEGREVPLVFVVNLSTIRVIP